MQQGTYLVMEAARACEGHAAISRAGSNVDCCQAGAGVLTAHAAATAVMDGGRWHVTVTIHVTCSAQQGTRDSKREYGRQKRRTHYCCTNSLPAWLSRTNADNAVEFLVIGQYDILGLYIDTESLTDSP